MSTTPTDGKRITALPSRHAARCCLMPPRNPRVRLRVPGFRINSNVTDNQKAPAVAMNAAGEFVVTWQS